MGTLLFILCWAGGAALVGRLASKKGQAPGFPIIMSMILSPITGLLIVALRRNGPPKNASQGEAKCPFCAECIQHGAVFCKHCRQSLPGGPVLVGAPSREPAPAPRERPPRATAAEWAWFTFILVMAMWLFWDWKFFI